MAAFEHVESEILKGIDPSTSSSIWACVQENSSAVGRNNTGIKLVVTEGDPGCLEIEVEDSSKATATLGIFTTNSDGHKEAVVTIKGKTTTEDTDPDNPPVGTKLKAKNKETDEVVADNCKIMVLPLRTVKFSNYTWRDPGHQDTYDVNAPTGSALKSLFDEIFLRQGCVEFILNEEDLQAEVHYDDNDNRKADHWVGTGISELDDHKNDLNWAGTVNAFWVASSGICNADGEFAPCPRCAEEYNDPPARGVLLAPPPTAGLVAVNDAGALKEVAMAHEFGHVGGLQHYDGSFPDGELPLMRSGFNESCQYQDVGKWLSHGEWKEMSNGAAAYEE